ncbi:MAG: T9SS type A sorting domain-containing protein [Bacteroidales bacterium]|nr:T9SS type A sorting domain-containing protein [Bacteroidales bacterium]MCF8338878.1 T9SS type A sorting domain-containing protein [Bacteroidales bacterium]
MLRIIILFLILPCVSMTQPGFSEKVIDTSDAATGITSIVPCDFNNDGYADITTSQSYPNEIAVYFNTGNGDYENRQLVSTAAYYPVDLAAADLNDDGWNDLISISRQDEKLAWYPNQNGSFGDQIVIDTGFFFTVEVVTDDFNADGYPDLIALDDTVVRYYQNDGEGNFTSSTLAGQTEFYSIDIADINGDDLPDVLLGTLQIYTYINNGDGTFTRDTRNDNLISSFIFEIETGDIDGDGDMDMAIYYSNTNPDIDWYENDGTGKFSLGGNITQSSNDVKRMELVDLNNDNHPDFLTAYGQTGQLVWMENNAQGLFSSENIIGTYDALLDQVATTDTDLDDDLDIFCSAGSTGLFAWENLLTATGKHDKPSTTQRLHPNPATNYVNLRNSSAGQVDFYNLQGKQLKENTLKKGANSISLNLPKGVYLVRWSDGKSHFTQKLVVK